MHQKDNNNSTYEQAVNIAYSSKLALIGGLLTTLGDAVSTYAASLEIEESIKSDIEQGKKDQQLEKRIREIEKKIESFQSITE